MRSAAVAVLVLGSAAGVAVQDRLIQKELISHVVNPEQLPPSPQQVNLLKVPDGFAVTVFARDLGRPRVIAVAGDGSVYVTRREPGDILVLRDTDGDGRADQARTAVRRPMLHGLTLDDRRAYFIGVSDLFSADIQADGTFANVTRTVDDLPAGGQHGNRTIRLGPDRMLYVSVGSTCNSCNESTPESATIVRLSLDGTSREIFASGLRNTIGFDWEPRTGELYGMDNGIDFLADDDQPEELNHIEHGKQYGWPYVYGKSAIYPHGDPPGEVTREEWARLSQEPVLTHTAHAAPMEMAFYTGAQFPAEYRGDAFAAMHGSWNRQPPSGYEVVRIRFQDGRPTRIEPFLQGFLTGGGGHPVIIGRPMGVAIAKDGALLVSDDANGVIYRIAYRGTATAAGPALASVKPAAVTPPAGGDAFALARRETQTGGRLAVASSAFAEGSAIPAPYSQYGERFSPALSWTGAPAATRSFAIMLEDPDAKQPKPFVHWLVYNLPPATTRLPESIPAALRLADPKGALQGRNSRGAIGYMGPRPPAGDPPHHYHFEVFALDTLLAVAPGLDREGVLKALGGHVLASGETVGTFARAP